VPVQTQLLVEAELKPDRLQFFLKQHPKLDTETVVRAAELDPTPRANYTGWILRQISKGDIKLGEDDSKVSEVLSKFDKYRNRRGWTGSKNVLEYGTYGDLAELVDKFEGGTEVEGDKSGIRAILVDAPSAEQNPYNDEWERDTKWCVKASLGAYEEYAPFVYFKKDGKPYALYSLKTGDCMDVYDRPIEVDRKHFAPFEDKIAKDAKLAYRYARDAVKGRWPEAEAAIAKDAKWAYFYAKDVVKGRWPEGEAAIAKDAEWAYFYAIYVVKGRWPEGEAAIAEDAEWAHMYASYVVKGRWPEGEAAIAEDAGLAYRYAKNS